MNKQEKRALFHALFFPGTFLFVLWLIRIVEYLGEFSMASFGIEPISLRGLRGILMAPLIHADFNHIINNSIPLLVLSVALFYLYRPIHYKVFFIIYFLSGIWVWAFARNGVHIGASGIVYGLVSFIFLSGLLRRDTGLMALSAFTVMFYGSMVWGILPIDYKISWESHLMGALSGLLCAFIYRKQGPQRKLFEWELFKDEETDDPEDAYWKQEEPKEGEEPPIREVHPQLPLNENSGGIEIRYHYVEQKDKGKQE